MNNELLVELFRFNHKTDYLPYFKKHTVAFHSRDRVLDLLDKLNKIEPFRFEKVEEFGLKINNIFVQTTDLISDIVTASSNEFTIEPVNTYRAIEDLTINNEDFYQKLNLFDNYLTQEQKENYASKLQFEYYASNSININKEYIGDHSIIIAHDIIKETPTFKEEIVKLLSDLSTGIWYYTSKENRVLTHNSSNQNKINTMLQAVTKQKSKKELQEIEQQNEIIQKFTDFNIATYDTNNSKILEQSIKNSDAKYISLDSKSDDLALLSQEIDKTFSYKIAGNILLEAKDKNADFIVVKSDESFKIFDHKQKEIEKAVGREIKLPIITLKQFNTLLSGEKDRKVLGFDTHKVSVPFL